MPQRIPDNFEVRKPRLLDNKEGPWSSVEEATLYITKDIRAQGQVVKILNAGSIEEWWWKDGIEDTDLIAKSSGGTTSAAWGDITGTLSNQTDLQSALDAIHGLPSGGDAGQLLAKNSATDYDVTWIDNYANWTSQLKHEVKLGESISKGQAVYVSSADGTNMIVSKASNTTEATSSKTLGLLEIGGSTNAKVKVITEGLLSGLDTSSATSAGDPVWLGTSGNLIYGLASKPSAPDHLVFIGIVTRKNNNNGEIFVKVQNGFELKELHDVQVQSPSNRNTIIFDSADSQWKSGALTKTDIGLSNVPNTDATNPVNITQSASYRFTTDTEKSTWNGKQDSLGFTPENVANKQTDLTASATNYPTVNAVNTGLATKQNTLTNPVTGTGTNNEIAAFNSTGSTITSLSTSTYPSLTELSYIKGLTSAIQTQINALPRVVYTNVTEESTSSTSATNLLSTFGFTISDANWPTGGMLKITGYIERTAGAGSAAVSVSVNGSTLRYAGASGQTLNYEFNLMKINSTQIRIGYGPSNTANASYQPLNLSSIVASVSGGNYVLTFGLFVGTTTTFAQRWMKAIMIP